MLKLVSPAKVNLFLHVEEKRADGFHNLASILQAVSLFDEISFSLAEKDCLTTNDPTLETDERNLIQKAVCLFKKKTGLHFGIKIHLEKKIPKEAGLGGGSSNAATTLFALYKLFPNSINLRDLMVFSEEIGSDVPFFFSLGTAFCQGKGEIVQNLLPPSFANSCWIIKPDLGLSTPKIFQNLIREDFSGKVTDHDIQLFLQGKKNFKNDLEAAAFRVMPSLKKIKDAFLNQKISMTGSGSAFFLFSEEKPELPPSYFLEKVHFIHRLDNDWY